MVLFTAEDHERVRAGQITVTWRAWQYAHVKASGIYATGFGGALEILDVRAVPVSQVTDEDAREAGHADVAALLQHVRGFIKANVTVETLLYRVAFRYLTEAPARAELDLETVAARLARLDRASKRGPWTLAILRVIEENPAVGSRHLAPEVGQEQASFKENVRKLKNLGLTISLGTGYELSDLGRRYLETLSDAGTG